MSQALLTHTADNLGSAVDRSGDADIGLRQMSQVAQFSLLPHDKMPVLIIELMRLWVSLADCERAANLAAVIDCLHLNGGSAELSCSKLPRKMPKAVNTKIADCFMEWCALAFWHEIC